MIYFNIGDTFLLNFVHFSLKVLFPIVYFPKIILLIFINLVVLYQVHCFCCNGSSVSGLCFSEIYEVVPVSATLTFIRYNNLHFELQMF